MHKTLHKSILYEDIFNNLSTNDSNSVTDPVNCSMEKKIINEYGINI